MSKLILVGGLPGSGKTFIGKALARRIGAAYLDKDLVAQCARGYLADSADAEQAIFRAEMVSSLGILGR